MNSKTKNQIKNGGIYWTDFKEFKIPEWGNDKNGNLHLSIVIEINKFQNKEMYLSIPITSNKRIFENHNDKIILKINITINGENKEHYALISQIRSIGRYRIKDFTNNIINFEKTVELQETINNFINHHFDKLINKNFDKYPNKNMPHLNKKLVIN